MPGCAICTFTLPSGRRCGVPALRGRAFCRHHDRSPRRIVQDNLAAKMARYRRELEAMDLPRLFDALLEKLDLIQAIIPAYPEAQLILLVATSASPCSCRTTLRMSRPIARAPIRRILSHEELEKFAIQSHSQDEREGRRVAPQNHCRRSALSDLRVPTGQRSVARHVKCRVTSMRWGKPRQGRHIDVVWMQLDSHEPEETTTESIRWDKSGIYRTESNRNTKFHTCNHIADQPKTKPRASMR